MKKIPLRGKRSKVSDNALEGGIRRLGGVRSIH